MKRALIPYYISRMIAQRSSDISTGNIWEREDPQIELGGFQTRPIHHIFTTIT